MIERAWSLLRACPLYSHDPEEDARHFIILNDMWGWACADGFIITDANVVRVAELYDRYGLAGLLLAHSEIEPNHVESEFHDINRLLQFARMEERLRAEIPDSAKRAYHKVLYEVGAA